MGGIRPAQPADPIDLLLDLQRLEVVELRLVALERAVDVVFAPLRCVALTLQAEGYRGALQRGWIGTEGHYSEGGGVQRGVTARVEGYRGALQ